MVKQTIEEYRRRRLQEFAIAKFDGNKASLGRALGYKDGAFVGQMLRGERPITEKTVEQIHSLPNGRGWFLWADGNAVQSQRQPWSMHAIEAAGLVDELEHDDEKEMVLRMINRVVLARKLPDHAK